MVKIPATQENSQDVQNNTAPGDVIAGVDSQLSPLLANLNPFRIVILKAVVDNMLSDNPETDTALARRLDIDRHSIANARKDTDFINALSHFTKEITRAKVDKYIGKLEKHADTSVKAIELLLKYSGEYIPTQRNQNVNANISVASNTSLDFLDDILVKLGAMGITLDIISQRFIELKNTGAF